MGIVSTLLDKAQKRRSIPSDNALAGMFGVSRQTVSKWRNGESYPTQDHIAQLADMAGDNAGTWLVQVQAEREQGPAGRAWAELAKRLSAAAAVLLLVMGATPYPAAAQVPDSSGGYTGLYIMSIRRWLRDLFRAPASLPLLPA